MLLAQLGGDGFSGLSRELDLVRPQRDCSHHCVTAPIVSLADRSQIMPARPWAPGIESDRYLRPARRQTHTHGIDALGEQVIRHKLTVTFGVVVAEIKIDDSAFASRGIAYQIDRFEMALIQRAKLTIDLRIGDDLIKRLGLHALNNSLHYRTVTA